MHLLYDANPHALAFRAALGLAGATLSALVGVRSRALTRSGGIATVVIGTAGFAFGGPAIAIALILYFASGSVLSRVTSSQAKRARELAQKHGPRDAMQVLANGAVGAACAVEAGILAASGHDSKLWLAASLGAIAAACGDTWSTEIGSLVGGTPRSIIGLRPVAPGTSGGVTPLGILAAALGGGFVGLAGLLAPALGALDWMALAVLTGFAGSVFDSIAGASVQGLWRCPNCGRILEAPPHPPCEGRPNLVRGWAWLDNDAVNLAASACGAVLGALIARA